MLFQSAQSYNTKCNTLHIFAKFILQNPNKRELQQIASNHSSDIEFEDFIKRYKYYAKEPYSFLVNNHLYHQIIHCDLGKIYYKMSISEKTSTINKKIEQNKV